MLFIAAFIGRFPECQVKEEEGGGQDTAWSLSCEENFFLRSSPSSRTERNNIKKAMVSQHNP
jgi:hypothetical protein